MPRVPVAKEGVPEGGTVVRRRRGKPLAARPAPAEDLGPLPDGARRYAQAVIDGAERQTDAAVAAGVSVDAANKYANDPNVAGWVKFALESTGLTPVLVANKWKDWMEDDDAAWKRSAAVSASALAARALGMMAPDVQVNVDARTALLPAGVDLGALAGALAAELATDAGTDAAPGA